MFWNVSHSSIFGKVDLIVKIDKVEAEGRVCRAKNDIIELMNNELILKY